MTQPPPRASAAGTGRGRRERRCRRRRTHARFPAQGRRTTGPAWLRLVRGLLRPCRHQEWGQRQLRVDGARPRRAGVLGENGCWADCIDDICAPVLLCYCSEGRAGLSVPQVEIVASSPSADGAAAQHTWRFLDLGQLDQAREAEASVCAHRVRAIRLVRRRQLAHSAAHCGASAHVTIQRRRSRTRCTLRLRCAR